MPALAKPQAKFLTFLFAIDVDDRAEFLQAAFVEMRRLYGTFDNYVHQALGITDDQLEQIRENLLGGGDRVRQIGQTLCRACCAVQLSRLDSQL